MIQSLFHVANPLRQLYYALGLFVLIVVLGTAGYMLIEAYNFLDALYMTIITLATVGFGEVHPLSDRGRIFTMILIVANLGTFTYLLSWVTNFFIDGEFIDAYKIFSHV